jgi:hypothetical protein
MRLAQRFALLISLCSPLLWAQSTPPAGAPTRMIVTTGHFYSRPAPLLTANDLIVSEDYEPLPVISLVPLRGERAGLELVVLVDNCSSCEAGSQFADLRKFINSQAPATSVGVAYIQEGKLTIAQNPTLNREQAVQALNTPTGNKPTTPFVALADLIRGWKPDSARHAVLMISNGIDPSPAEGSQNASAEAAIQEAQRAGVMVYAIYHPSADYETANRNSIYKGQVQLAHVAIETGGEAYFLGFGPLPSLGPFLSDIADHLANQYLVEFVAKPGEASELEEVTVKCKLSDVEIIAPNKVWVEVPVIKNAKGGRQ